MMGIVAILLFIAAGIVFWFAFLLWRDTQKVKKRRR